MRRAVALAFAFVACSSSPAAKPPPSFTLEVIAQQAGLGCVSTSPISGNGGRVVAKDGQGNVIGSGTWALTPGAKTCDWSTQISLSRPADFVALEGDKAKLPTLTAADVADGRVVLRADITGQITVS